MRVIVAHNFYCQPGGEDEVFNSEVSLLRERGLEVQTFTAHNDEIERMGKVSAARATLWNTDTSRRLKNMVRDWRADVVHFHNTFPLMSPAVYYAAHDAGAATVQTLHNYRLLCPRATFYRDGAPCEQCLGKVPWRAVLHSCYRNRSTSLVVATMLTTHRALGTYERAVDAYIVLSQFARGKFVEAGWPGAKMHVKPNFLNSDPGIGAGDGGYALFVGRLTEEKGIAALIDAWRQLNGAFPLKIAGDGPMRPEVEKAIREIPGIEFLGRRPMPEIIELLGRAKMLVFPSLWYEGMPRVIVESFAKGTPVMASNLGTMAEVIHDGRDGWLIPPGDATQLAATVRRAMTEPATQSEELRHGARNQFEQNYSAARNFDTLMEIYQRAIQTRAAQSKTHASSRPDTLPDAEALPR